MKIQDIKIDINVMCEYEKITGRSLIKLMSNLEELKISDIRALIQAGLGLSDEKEAGNVLMEYMQDETQAPILDVLSEKLSESGISKKKKE